MPLIPSVIVISKQKSIVAGKGKHSNTQEMSIRISTDDTATSVAKRLKSNKESHKKNLPIKSVGGISLEDAMELSDDGIEECSDGELSVKGTAAVPCDAISENKKSNREKKRDINDKNNSMNKRVNSVKQRAQGSSTCSSSVQSAIIPSSSSSTSPSSFSSKSEPNHSLSSSASVTFLSGALASSIIGPGTKVSPNPNPYNSSPTRSSRSNNPSGNVKDMLPPEKFIPSFKGININISPTEIQSESNLLNSSINAENNSQSDVKVNIQDDKSLKLRDSSQKSSTSIIQTSKNPESVHHKSFFSPVSSSSPRGVKRSRSISPMSHIDADSRYDDKGTQELAGSESIAQSIRESPRRKIQVFSNEKTPKVHSSSSSSSSVSENKSLNKKLPSGKKVVKGIKGVVGGRGSLEEAWGRKIAPVTADGSTNISNCFNGSKNDDVDTTDSHVKNVPCGVVNNVLDNGPNNVHDDTVRRKMRMPIKNWSDAFQQKK